MFIGHDKSFLDGTFKVPREGVFMELIQPRLHRCAFQDLKENQLLVYQFCLAPGKLKKKCLG